MSAITFGLERPETLDAAKQMIATPGAVLLAGGQSLIPLLNQRVVKPNVVVDISRIAELKQINWNGQCLSIGAMVTLSALQNSKAITLFPLLAEGIASTANPPVRNRATLVGNLVRANALGELSTICVALAGQFVLENSSGARIVSADEFFLSHLRSAVQENEIVVRVEFPGLDYTQRGTGFAEITHRAGIPPMVCVAVNLKVDTAGRISNARIAAGGILERPMRCAKSEAAMVGVHYEEAAQAIESEDAQPAAELRYASYAIEVLPIVVRRAMGQAVAAITSSLTKQERE